MPDPKVIIVILNWNGMDDTLECLESVYKIDYQNFDVIVVDNDSSDNSVKAIQGNFSEVTILETGSNLGFAGGNNVGIRYALKNGADYILLLNNDTIVDSKLLKNFINASISIQHPAIFGAKIYYYSEPNKIWHAGVKWVKNRSYFIHIGQGSIDNGQDYNSVVETNYACGCAFFVKAELLSKVGIFDEKFFLTFEEADLCYRARKAGYKSFFVPEARVWHKVSVSFGGENSVLFKYFLTRNKLLWAEKNLPLHELLVVYKDVLCVLLKCMLPPRFRLNKSVEVSLLKKIYISLREYKYSFVKKFRSPVRKAKMQGIFDYCLHRFDSCSKSVEFFGK